MRIAAGIATVGRPDVLATTLAHLTGQARPPDRILICPGGQKDAGGIGDPAVETVHGKLGLTSQRNALLEAARGMDLLIFFDDDFLAADDYVAATARLFERHPDIVMATGTVLMDGINGPGVTASAAVARLREPAVAAPEVLTPVYNGYGCNMAVRLAPVLRHAVRFDEALPLYGWLEDVDFSRRLAAYGGIVRSNQLRGVHLGVKHGRNSGVRFGYSQIANPLYMVGKGSLSPRRAAAQMARNLAMNLMRLGKPEPWIDRGGRLKGNARALKDLFGRRLSPERILELEQ